MSYREKKERKRAIEKKEKNKQTHFTVVDPETLFICATLNLSTAPKHALRNTKSSVIDVCSSNSNW